MLSQKAQNNIFIWYSKTDHNWGCNVLKIFLLNLGENKVYVLQIISINYEINVGILIFITDDLTTVSS